MEKKIRVTLPKGVIEILEEDISSFKINKNYLLNYIFCNYNGNFDKNIDYLGKKNVIQFNLNKDNKKIYYEILKEKNIQVEADFIRKMIYSYINQTKNNRELFIFKNIVDKIDYCIKNKKILLIIFSDGRKTKVAPYYLGSTKLELANYLFCFDYETQKYKNYKLNNFNSVFITNEKANWTDIKYIKNIIENFDPFLSVGKLVKAKLSPEGIKLLNSLTLNRPEIIKIEDNIYTFTSSEEQAKRYFSYFLDEIEILEPLSLREWFKIKLKKALVNYE